MSASTKLLLVDFLSDRVPGAHPQLVPFLEKGWSIQSIEYRIVEPAAPKLLVKLIAPLQEIRQRVLAA